MKLHTNLYFYRLIIFIDALYLCDVAVTNCLRGRTMPARKFDHFLFSSQRDDHRSQNEDTEAKEASLKQIVLIRHGQTYMNELIGGGGITFGQPNFTDIFHDPEDQKKYHDSPLSDVGIQQARSLNSKLRDLKDNKPGAFNALGLSQSFHSDRNKDKCTNVINIHFLDAMDLVVVSPLTRALQTLELSLYEHIINRNDNRPNVPIVAMAAVAERLYLVSDLGKPRSELKSNYPFVDFDTAFSINCVTEVDCSNEKEHLDTWHFCPTKQLEDRYTEWRPHGQGQLYACVGEPSEHFDRRMSNFYYWLESREERCIAIVCHAGVIDWMTSGQQFSNCELRVQTFNSLRPRGLQDRIPHNN
jgi:broad specificity phosphatase PhoE